MPFNEFGRAVRSGLADINMTQEDFMRLLRKRYGVFIDSSYIYKLKTGRQHVPKMEKRIMETLEDLKGGFEKDPSQYLP